MQFWSGTALALVILLTSSQAAGTKKKGKRTPAVTQPIKSEKSIVDKVRVIIAEQIGVSPKKVALTARYIEDLGVDSLDTVELVMAFEEEFNIEIRDEDAEKLQTVSQTVGYIEAKLAKSESQPKGKGR